MNTPKIGAETMNKVLRELEALREACEIYVYADFSGKGLAAVKPGEDDLRVCRVRSLAALLQAAAAAYAMGAHDVQAIISFPNPAAAVDALFAAMRESAQNAAEGHPSPKGDSVVTDFADARKLH